MDWSYAILPTIVFLVLALAHATDPRDVNIYVAMWRKMRGN